ncbi:tRNA glutamyl-Q(34) synthetase GluQRS [Pelagicoccus sp. SDUM812005]|uniref:tRNA glutamyl-Q(34) synthetase GluQRS n=1 Tax=Pelagicoccus sp. SDUM812005 TaxID=3041257 RepID=UPI00280F13FF|nr:tRNA glutamyl-Q(34) synthetase GluQRS [Pelagicoccus sp. SDUM812005]MDQ8180015.1 tRNA glutamyl-Q(34) synthetase GluQRS [Pelagicoccus sp. SDUM812005]
MVKSKRRIFGEYVGRVAPTPTGLMHLGHACTFLEAQRRARAAGGKLLLRIEDLDQARCKPEFVEALAEDLAWAGLSWEPEVLRQSERLAWFREVLGRLREAGVVYPCSCSRKDVAEAIRAPHVEGQEPLYPGTCREREFVFGSEAEALAINWRFRVPDGEAIAFEDGRLGAQHFVAGRDFGDFLVWRKDGFPSYELAVVADDVAQGITEVVRGEDLLASTARQLLLYRALGEEPPAFYHCPLILDTEGKRLAKRAGAMGLRELRAGGARPEELEEIAKRGGRLRGGA